MAATALAVSWLPTAITGTEPARLVSIATSGSSGPMTVPGNTSCGNMPVGIPSLPIISVAQRPSRASRHCVVVASVYSAVATPESQYPNRFGMGRSVFAAPRIGSSARTMLNSWYRVLICNGWMPVAS